MWDELRPQLYGLAIGLILGYQINGAGPTAVSGILNLGFIVTMKWKAWRRKRLPKARVIR